MSRRYVIIVVVVVEERSPRLFNRCSIPERGNKQDGVIYPKETTIGGYVIFFQRSDERTGPFLYDQPRLCVDKYWRIEESARILESYL